MVDESQIERSKRIQQRTGKTFHLATRLLPERIRHPTYVLYAFFRKADEVVDTEDPAPPPVQRERLERFRDAALGRIDTDDPVLAAFADIRERHGIEPADIDAFVDAMLTDISKDRYEEYAELEAYMDGSAAAVGRMMTSLMAPDDPEAARPYATALGEAFQLSNFIRDVREDLVERDRVYLPRETLDRYDVSEEQLRRFEVTDGFRAAIRDELARAEALYRRGVAGIALLPRDCQFGVLLAAVLYADHHRLVRRLDCDVLSTTPSLSLTRKLSLLARTRWHWLWSKDPEAVFRTVSVVPDADRDRRPGGHNPGRAGNLPTR